MKCEGNCEQHTGKVVRVHVWAGAKDWGEFNYCETAIKHDTSRGLTVEIATKGSVTC